MVDPQSAFVLVHPHHVRPKSECAGELRIPGGLAVESARNPLRCGVTGNCASQKGGAGALPVRKKTMAHMFHAVGYATAHVSRWHLDSHSTVA